MKQILLLLFYLSPPVLLAAQAQNVELTLRVDMSQQTVSPNGVHVAGSFQSEAGYGSDWVPNTTPLTDADNDNIYEVSLSLPAGLYQYKFINGNSWGEMPETTLAGCGIDDGGGNINREVGIGASDVRLPVVSFNECNTQLIFSVNMGQQTVSANGVHVTGNFQSLAGYGTDWQPGATPMFDTDGDGTYVARISMPAGGIYEYKYINGNSWDGAEQLTTACATDDGSGNLNRVAEATTELNYTPVYCFSSCEICGNTPGPPQTEYNTYWWNDAVFYEIFVRSFYDSGADGKGDFKGLIEKLDYLNDGDPNTHTDLGIKGIWLMPMMESPSYHGYDVTNYKATEPDYGSMADFEAFLAAAHERGIKVIIDFVMNHSSSQHPWFTQSASSTTNQYRDWYVWSDTDPGWSVSWNNTVWHPKNGDYYYGIFWGGMPDLNWSNPELKSAMWDITRFWLNKGVDGYRIDAVKYLDEDGSTYENTPETFALLEEFNEVVKSTDPDAFTVGEAWSGTSEVVPYVVNDRLDMAFEFDLSTAILQSVKSNDPAALRSKLDHVTNAYPRLQYATFLSNHDQKRVLDELGQNMPHMKQAAALYLTMPGVPFLYYGEEVGMLGSGVDEDKRKPMQWTPGTKAGFTTGTPWRSINSNYTDFNVQTMEADPNSLLNHYKKLIRLRNQHEALRKGYYLPVDASNTAVLSYARVYEQEAVVVASNFGSSTIKPSLSLAVSTLNAGTYFVTELYSGQTAGTVTVDEQGAISQWTPANVSLAADQTQIFLISQNSQPPTGLAEEQHLLELQLYPNPATDIVHIQLKETYRQNNQIRVLDISGKLVRQISFAGTKHSLDTSSLPNGTYFLRIQSGNATSTKRLVVTH